MPTALHIGIAGAGAVGCYYGLALQQAGCKVSFLARGAHLQAMQRQGLQLVSQAETHTYIVQASDNPGCLNDCDVIVLACKTTQLKAMCTQLLPVVNEHACLLTLQNGVQAAEQVAAYFPQHCVLAGSAFIGVRIEKPAYVIHSAAGHIRLGAWQGEAMKVLQSLISAWLRAGVDAQLEVDMRHMLWQKMLWNCGFNAITALTRRYARDVALHDGMAVWVRAAMLEVVEVAMAMGIKLDAMMVDKHLQLTCEAGEVKSSMWQDISSRKATENAAMNGYIAEQGKLLGIAVPVNSMLANMMDLAEGAYLAD